MSNGIDGTYTLDQTELAIAQEEAFGKLLQSLGAVDGSAPPVNEVSFQVVMYVPKPVALVKAPDDASVAAAIAARGGAWSQALRTTIFVQSQKTRVAVLREN
ncbi:hypothetical protein PHYC_03257 [Phycisphaerales bacterium]|nr:hypothetical protein PHYC_03257 [Phycisphaerales bacterium]